MELVHADFFLIWKTNVCRKDGWGKTGSDLIVARSASTIGKWVGLVIREKREGFDFGLLIRKWR